MAESDFQPGGTSSGEVPVVPTVVFYHQRQRLFATPLDARLEIGRQRQGEPAPPARVDQPDGARIVLAALDDLEVSRSHLQLALTSDGRIAIANRSSTLPVRLSPSTVIAPGESLVAAPPVLVQFGSLAVRVDPPEAEDDLELAALPERTIPPGFYSKVGPTEIPDKRVLDNPAMLQWLETVMGGVSECRLFARLPRAGSPGCGEHRGARRGCHVAVHRRRPLAGCRLA